jgi:hypothetical protein
MVNIPAASSRGSRSCRSANPYDRLDQSPNTAVTTRAIWMSRLSSTAPGTVRPGKWGDEVGTTWPLRRP